MVVYSIRDLEKLCGVKAHTLRIWEKRYGIIRPHRTKTNIRYYLEDDLKRVLNIALLNRNGIKISKIANMSPEEIRKKAAELTDVDEAFENQLDGLTLSMIELDTAKFDRILEANIRQRGFTKTMLEVVHPFLDKLGVMWMSGSIKSVHERVVTNVIRQKTVAAIDRLPVSSTEQVPAFVLYLPEGESQELSVLFMHFLIKKSGFRVINLGVDVSVEDLVDAQYIFDAQYLFTMINDSFSTTSIQPYVDALARQFPNQQILMTGFQVMRQQIRWPPNCRLLASIQAVMDFLGAIAHHEK